MKIIKDKYKISFGLQYDAWELTILLPDWEEYESEAEAHKRCEKMSVFALVTADAIFLSYDKMLQKIMPSEMDVYFFSVLSEDAYKHLGPPLSPEDIDQLIEKDELERVLFSSHYMLTENDYRKFEGDLEDAYWELYRKHAKLHQMPEMEGYAEYQGISGYLFECIWYGVERVK